MSPRPAPFSRALCWLALAAAAAPAAAAPKPLVVAVLYFHNNTGEKDLDVMKKGFADMMITDLSSVKELVVVERDRLQDLLGELKLQRSRFINKRTAVKLGQGLGATHVITGAFATSAPLIRIDMRMIEVSSGQLALAAQVTGKRSKIFDLEQQLVAKFTGGLKLKLSPAPFPRTKVPDVKTLVQYSRGINMADQGRLKQARQQLTRVVSAAPTFGLARLRLEQMKKRLVGARTRREKVIGEQGQALRRAAVAFLKGRRIEDLDQARARLFVAYRQVRGWFLLRELKAHLSGARGVKVIRRGQGRAARGLMIGYAQNQRRLLEELERFYSRFAAAGRRGGADTERFELPPDEQRRAEAAGLKERLSTSPRRQQQLLAEFLLLGRCRDGSGSGFTAAPPLSFQVPRYRAAGIKLLRALIAAQDAALRADPRAPKIGVIQSRELYGDALLLQGKREEAIAAWQEILERYPTSSRFKWIESRIKKELGLIHDAAVAGRARYAAAMGSCDDMDLRVGWINMLSWRLRTRGLAAIREQVAEIERHCRGNPAARSFWPFLYSHAALAGARHGDCALFNEQIKRFLQAGGSPSDARGYRKNYSKCP